MVRDVGVDAGHGVRDVRQGLPCVTARAYLRRDGGFCDGAAEAVFEWRQAGGDAL